MDMNKLVLILIVGLVAGLSEGASGAGWGVFTLAALVLLGFDPKVAVTSSIFVELILGLANNWFHFQLGAFDKNIVLPLLAAGLVGIVVGAKFSARIPEQYFTLLIGVVILFFGQLIIIKAVRSF
ncbi:hypothetical protein ES703_119866 [subsurface metagenome]